MNDTKDNELHQSDGAAQPAGTPPAVNTQPQTAGQPAAPAAQEMPLPESRFTGGAFANFFIGLISAFVSLITLSLAYPAMMCWKMRWETKHTYINGRHLVFDGKGIQLFGKYIIWFLLSVITLGIYFLVCGRINIVKWQTQHTHIEGVEKGESKFTGGALGLLGHTLLVLFVSIITLSFGVYWGICHLKRWYAKHTIYDGYTIEYDGKAIQLFGKCICWALLTIITIGIYSFWFIVKTKKWVTKHTVFVPGQALPPVTDRKYEKQATAYAAAPVAKAPAAPVAAAPATPVATAPAPAPAPAPVPARPYTQPYAQPYAQPAPVQKQSNGMAVAGFVLSLLSFLGFSFTFIMPLLGIIFSGVGIGKAKTANSGMGMAVAGLVLGILSILWLIGMIALLVLVIIPAAAAA